MTKDITYPLLLLLVKYYEGYSATQNTNKDGKDSRVPSPLHLYIVFLMRPVFIQCTDEPLFDADYEHIITYLFYSEKLFIHKPQTRLKA